VPGPFRHPFIVRWAEVDLQSVVFNPHYFAYFDLAITELFRAAFGSYGVLAERGIDLAVGEATARFFAPARFDDELVAEVTVSRMGTTGITTEYDLKRHDHLLVHGTVRHVVINLGTQEKTPIPDWLRNGLAPYAA
jgi:acyl-CoA thioester hydrolase